jgi:hypothetical protein
VRDLIGFLLEGFSYEMSFLYYKWGLGWGGAGYQMFEEGGENSKT